MEEKDIWELPVTIGECDEVPEWVNKKVVAEKLMKEVKGAFIYRVHEYNGLIDDCGFEVELALKGEAPFISTLIGVLKGVATVAEEVKASDVYVSRMPFYSSRKGNNRVYVNIAYYRGD